MIRKISLWMIILSLLFQAGFVVPVSADEPINYDLSALSTFELNAGILDANLKYTKSFAVAEVGTRTFAYIGKENVDASKDQNPGGLYVFDITDGQEADFVQYYNAIGSNNMSDIPTGGRLAVIEKGNEKYLVFCRTSGRRFDAVYACAINADGTLDTSDLTNIGDQTVASGNGGVKIIGKYIVFNGVKDLYIYESTDAGFVKRGSIASEYDIHSFDAQIVSENMYIMIGGKNGTDRNACLYKSAVNAEMTFTKTAEKVISTTNDAIEMEFVDTKKAVASLTGAGGVLIDFSNLDTELVITQITKKQTQIVKTLGEGWFVAGGNGNVDLYNGNNVDSAVVDTISSAGIYSGIEILNGQIFALSVSDGLKTFDYGADFEKTYNDLNIYNLGRTLTGILHGGVESTIINHTKHIEVINIGNKTFAYVGKENVSTSTDPNPGGLYVYDITDGSNPEYLQSIRSITNPDNTAQTIDINSFSTEGRMAFVENGNNRFLVCSISSAISGTMGVYAFKIASDGKIDLSVEPTRLATGTNPQIESHGSYVTIARYETTNEPILSVFSCESGTFELRGTVELDTDELGIVKYDIEQIDGKLYVAAEVQHKKYKSGDKFYTDKYAVLYEGTISDDRNITFVKKSEADLGRTVATGSVALLDKNTAMFAIYDNEGVEVVDFSNPENPVIKTETDLKNVSNILSLGDEYALIYQSGVNKIHLYNMDSGIVAQSGLSLFGYGSTTLCNGLAYVLGSEGIEAYAYKTDIEIQPQTNYKRVSGRIAGWSSVTDSARILVDGNEEKLNVKADGSFSYNLYAASLDEVFMAVVSVIRNNKVVALRATEITYTGGDASSGINPFIDVLMSSASEISNGRETDAEGVLAGNNAGEYIKFENVYFGETPIAINGISAEVAKQGTGKLGVYLYDDELETDDTYQTEVEVIKNKGIQIARLEFTGTSDSELVVEVNEGILKYQKFSQSHIIYITAEDDSSFGSIRSFKLTGTDSFAIDAYKDIDALMASYITAPVDGQGSRLKSDANGDYYICENKDEAYIKYDDVNFGTTSKYITGMSAEVATDSENGAELAVYLYDGDSTTYSSIKSKGTKIGRLEYTGSGNTEFKTVVSDEICNYSKFNGEHAIYILSEDGEDLGNIKSFKLIGSEVFSLNPFKTISVEQATYITPPTGYPDGTRLVKDSNGEYYVGQNDSRQYIKYENVDFGSSAKIITGVKADIAGGQGSTSILGVYIYDGELTAYGDIKSKGTKIGRLEYVGTGFYDFKDEAHNEICVYQAISGKHTVYLHCENNGTFGNIKSFSLVGTEYTEEAFKISAFSDINAIRATYIHGTSRYDETHNSMGSNHGGWFGFAGVDFGSGSIIDGVSASVAISGKGRFAVYMDPKDTSSVDAVKQTGTLLATVSTESHSYVDYANVDSVDVRYFKKISGLHTIYIVPDGASIGNFKSLRFSKVNDTQEHTTLGAVKFYNASGAEIKNPKKESSVYASVNVYNNTDDDVFYNSIMALYDYSGRLYKCTMEEHKGGSKGIELIESKPLTPYEDSIFRPGWIVKFFVWTKDANTPALKTTSMIESGDIETYTEVLTMYAGENYDRNSCTNFNKALWDFSNRDWAVYENVNFGDKGYKRIFAEIASNEDNAQIEFRLDSKDGKLIGTISAVNSGNLDAFEMNYAAVEEDVTGIHDLYIVGGQISGNIRICEFGFDNVEKIPTDSTLEAPEMVSFEMEDVKRVGSVTVISDEKYYGANALSVSGDAEISYTFDATGIEVRGTLIPEGGSAEIYLDGEISTTINCYSAYEMNNKALYTASGLDPTKTHTVKIKNVGDENIIVEGAKLYNRAIRVICIGDSITAGAALGSSWQFYPWRLKEILGRGYTTFNYGVSGSTLLNDGDRSYILYDNYTKSLNSEADVIVIMLGTNDGKQGGKLEQSKFVDHYKQLINTYQTKYPNARIILNTSPWAWVEGFGIEPETINSTVYNGIVQTAIETGNQIVDINYVTRGKPEIFVDKDYIHPNMDGALLIAQKVSEGVMKPAITYENMKVCEVKGDKRGIYTFISDDGYYDSVSWFDEQFEKYGLHGSVAMICDYVVEEGDETENRGTVEEWQDIFDKGRFDLINHSYTHKAPLPTLSQDELNYEILDSLKWLRETFPGQKVLGFCTPYNQSNLNVYNTVKESHYALRDGAGYNSLNPTEDGWFKIVHKSSTERTGAEEMNGYIDDVIENKEWVVVMWHGIEEDQKSIATEHFEYLNLNLDNVWSSSFNEAIMYLKEKQSAKITFISQSDEKIVFDVTDNLDDDLFDYPLTVALPVVPGADNIISQVTQNGVEREFEVRNNVIYVDVVPDAGNVTILF